MFLAMVAIFAIMPWVLPLLPKTILGPVIIYCLCMLIGFGVYYFIAAPEIRKSLRRQLNELNIRVCIECGFDLRESIDLGRCPECGTKIEKHELKS